MILFGGAWWPTTRSLHLQTLSEVTLVERRNGSGDIIFGRPLFSLRFPRGNWSDDDADAPRFEFLSRVREVYEIIRQAQAWH